MTTRYRIEYTEIKPGGTEVQQSDLIVGRRVDVNLHLAPRLARIVRGSVKIFEGTASDGEPRRIYGFPGENE
jgi:hypothetical protein